MEEREREVMRTPRIGRMRGAGEEAEALAAHGEEVLAQEVPAARKIRGGHVAV